jgi:hypothetical protein
LLEKNAHFSGGGLHFSKYSGPPPAENAFLEEKTCHLLSRKQSRSHTFSGVFLRVLPRQGVRQLSINSERPPQKMAHFS